MKKIIIAFILSLVVTAGVYLPETEAAYLPEYDKYVEVTPEKAKQIADLLGIKGTLSKETADLSFQYQEAIIAKIEKILGKEIDHYYVWLTIDGTPVLGIDPPVAYF